MQVNRHDRRCARSFILLLGLLALIHSERALAQSNEPAQAATQELELRRTDLNRPVPLLELEKTLAESSILVMMPKGETLSFYDVSIGTLARSDFLLRATPEVLVAAVLSGEIQVNGETAEAGEAIAWPAGAGDIEVVEFDAGKFLAASRLELRPDTKAHLEAVAQWQERLKFWGLLEQAHFNRTAPFKDGDEDSARQRYLRNPVVLHLIRQHPEAELLRRGVAEAFVEALRTRDAQTIEWLISPLLFVDDPDQLRDPEWAVARQDFAFLIMIDHWDTPLADATLESTDEASSWIVRSSTQQYRLWLEPFDGMIFVTAFEPIDEGDGGAAE